MVKKIWTEEIKDFVIQNANGLYNYQLAELINKTFNTNFTVQQVNTFKGRYHIKANLKCNVPPTVIERNRIYSRELIQFIRDNAKGLGNVEMTELVNKTYNLNLSPKRIKQIKKNYKISSGLDGRFNKGHIPGNKGKKMSKEQYEKCKATMFKKGHLPKNHKPLGSERTTKDGYKEIKIAEPNKWELKHVQIWKSFNGPIPAKHCIIFLDGNKNNFDIKNLACISYAENLKLNQKAMRTSNAELTEVCINTVKLEQKIKDIEKRNEKH